MFINLHPGGKLKAGAEEERRVASNAQQQNLSLTEEHEMQAYCLSKAEMNLNSCSHKTLESREALSFKMEHIVPLGVFQICGWIQQYHSSTTHRV